MRLYFDIFKTNARSYDRQQEVKHNLFFDWVGNGNVLDIGYVSSPNRFLKGYVIGVDRGVRENIENYKNTMQVDISYKQLPILDDFFDGVCMGDVLEHMDKPYEALLEVNRVLKPNGILALSIPNIFYPPHAFRSATGKYEEADDMTYSEHVYSFTIYNIKLLLKRTGFKVEKLQGFRLKMPFLRIAICSKKVPYWLSTQLIIKARKVAK